MDGNTKTTVTITRPDGTMEQMEDSHYSYNGTTIRTYGMDIQ